ncbi:MULTISPECIES: hypothetical protein [Pseudomonadaceae]|uniref:hypothetical protein n=1 Tax=Pseudomonadaceae TaxID=135621 RepID=UPI0015E35683|nr:MULTISPECIES: hypothetical protein [Pseudomonadaceae]MBA1276813.1 hypothetical protein [Stutzerimonas stutzeri]MBC8651391.1 hypothetical protein [Pseudomonas sp. MT4]QXY93261.1 hypothetical protein GYM54_17480 [Pseudomonas sp. MTM4]
MTELKRYRIHYLINGNPASLTLDAFEEPAIGQAELEILLHHVREPRAATDAPWEIPERASEHSRMAELGVSDIQIEEEKR